MWEEGRQANFPAGAGLRWGADSQAHCSQFGVLARRHVVCLGARIVLGACVSEVGSRHFVFCDAHVWKRLGPTGRPLEDLRDT